MTPACVILLAGGNATRLPGKLALERDGVPLLARVYRNVASNREVVLSRGASFDDRLAALLPIASVVDRYAGRGPLGGLLTAMQAIDAPRAFAIAADMPFVDAALLDRLEARRRDGDDALVPAYDVRGERHVEPLAALYDCRAFVREGLRVLESGHGSIRRVLAHLNVRYVEDEPPHLFANLNTPEDYAALLAQERQPA